MDCGKDRAEVSIGPEEVGVGLCVTAGSQRRVVMSMIASRQEQLSWTSERENCETRCLNIDVSCVAKRKSDDGI